MSDIRDFFIKSLDEAESGINAMMNKLMSKLGGLDPEVKDVLDKQGILPQYFSFRYKKRLYILKSRPYRPSNKIDLSTGTCPLFVPKVCIIVLILQVVNINVVTRVSTSRGFKDLGFVIGR